MGTASPAIARILSEHLTTLPPDWLHEDGSPRRVARQAVFWGAAAELMAATLLGAPLPPRITVGRAGVPLSIPAATWECLGAELGLDRKESAPALEILHRHLLGAPSGRCPDLSASAGRLAVLLPPLLLTLVLLTLHLERIGRAGRATSFDYQFRELGQLARTEIPWAALGPFDEPALVSALFEHAGAGITQTHRLLRTPFHEYWVLLRRRLPETRGAEPAPRFPDAPLLPPSYFQQLITSPGQEAPLPPAAPGEGPADEMDRLLAENKALRAALGHQVLPRLLLPLLTVPEPPLQALQRAADASSGLARELILVLRTAIQAGDLSFVGEPGALLSISLPSPEYRLEGVPGAWDGQVRPLFRVGRRGIRLGGMIMTPALVIPVRGER